MTVADFQKRHYEAIAAIIKPAAEMAKGFPVGMYMAEEVDEMVKRLAEMFEQDNRLFDRDRFFWAVYGESEENADSRGKV